jgi:hypothetical protein
MTEDEAWEELERKQQQAQELDVRREAQTKAIEFIENNGAIELGIMTLRKAFEMGYRFGYSDAVMRSKNAAHKP